MNDILMIMSNDPDKITFFDVEYGTKNVEAAIKQAAILLYPTGTVDENLSDFLWSKRHGLMTTFLPDKYRQLWSIIISISKSLFQMSNFHIPLYHKLSIEFAAQNSELSIRMSIDPDSIRNMELSQEIGRSTSEIGISHCKHILECVMRGRHHENKTIFQLRRNKKILHHGICYLSGAIHNYDRVFLQIHLIVEKYWNLEADHQKDALAVLLIMDTKLIYSKFLFNSIEYDNECLAIIEEKVEVCLKQAAIDNKKGQIFLKDCKGFLDTTPTYPIIARIRMPKLFNASSRFSKYLRKELKDEPSYNILESSSHSKHIVCSNPT